MKFDSNLAWKQAVAAIMANRDVLLALSGVFFLLPSLAFSLFFPQPEPSAGMSVDQISKMTGDYYMSALPGMIPMAILQAAGTLGLLTLLTDRTRPTVGDAIKQGFAGTIPYFLAQLILGAVLGIGGGLLMAIALASGSKALIALLAIPLLVFAVYAAIKTSLVGPVIAVDGERNPIAALKRSWALTKGNSVRIAAFFILVAIAFLIVMMLIMGVFGSLASLAMGAQAGEIVSSVIAAAMGALMSLCFAAIMAATHRQLAGPSAEAVSAPFE